MKNFSGNKWVKRIGIFFTLFCFLYIFETFNELSSSNEFQDYIGRLFWPAIGLSIFYFLGISLNAWGWALLFTKLHRLSIFKIHLGTQIGKYLPGNFGHFLGRQALVNQLGFSHKEIGLRQVMDLGLSLLGALVLIYGTLCFSSTHQVVPLEYQFYLLLFPWDALFLLFVSLVGFLYLKKTQPLLMDGAPIFFGSLFFYVAFLFVSALTFVALVVLTGTDVPSIPGLFFGFLIAWVFGFVIIGSPGGIGVREATLVFLFSSQISSGPLIAAVAVHRIIAIFSEILGFGAYRFLNRKK